MDSLCMYSSVFTYSPVCVGAGIVGIAVGGAAGITADATSG